VIYATAWRSSAPRGSPSEALSTRCSSGVNAGVLLRRIPGMSRRLDRRRDQRRGPVRRGPCAPAKPSPLPLLSGSDARERLRVGARLQGGELRWRGRVGAQSSQSGWLVRGHSCVEWPPRAGTRSTTRFAPPRVQSPRLAAILHANRRQASRPRSIGDTLSADQASVVAQATEGPSFSLAAATCATSGSATPFFAAVISARIEIAISGGVRLPM
jgi:hypothetical protein